jgi:alpha-galactosidase
MQTHLSKENLMKKVLLSIALLYSFNAYGQKFSGLALTPPMGWNSWNTFACGINENKIREVADIMISSGMKDAGYQYVIIDDCWQGGRDSLGFIYPDRMKFPSGMKALADYIHSKGLKFGIYSDAGDSTCAHYLGSRGHEYQDAISYAQWGVDFLKYDWCRTDSLNAFWAYTTMRDAIYSAGRPIVFNMCEWGNNNPWLWGKDVAHLWRTTGDITNCFDCQLSHGTWSAWGIMKIIYIREGIRNYAGPDHWNDLDMMEVGNGMTTNEDRAHFSMWCMLASPLIAGNDIRHMSNETKQILTNREAIAVSQDSLGIQGFRYNIQDSMEIWAKPLAQGNWAVCFLNRSLKPQKLEFDWSQNIIIDDFAKRELNASKAKYKIRDIWNKNNIGSTKKILTGEIQAHDVLMLRLTE